MRNQLIIFAFFLSILTFPFCTGWDVTSEEDCEYPDYSDCNTTEPFNVKLEISLTNNDDFPENNLTLYDGYIEDGIIYDTFTVQSNYFEIEVPVNRRYSAKVMYISNSDTIIAVDGTKIVKNSKVNCDSICWTVSGKTLDLTLK